jgi:hypothetical protein
MRSQATLLALAAAALLAAAASAADFYAAPNGSAAGTGDIGNPWDLQTALQQPAAVQAGDTIWLRGGTYTGHFVALLAGSSTAPIVVRQYPGERATIDGNASGNDPALEIHGVNAWYWGFEITNSDPSRWSDTPSTPPARRGMAVEVAGDHVKLIHLVLHDTNQGVLTSSSVNDTEIAGCLIYYNGYDSTDRGHGHGIYVQNDPGNATKSVHDNFVFEQFGYGLHGYTTGTSLDNIEYRSNTVFDNGGLSNHGWTTNILLGGLKIANNPSLIANSTYNQVHAGANNLGYSAGCANPSITDNYLDGDTALKIVACSNVAMTGNTFYDTISGFTSTQFPNNTYYASRPAGSKVFLRASSYEPGRAHLAIYNWDLASSVPVDVSSLMTPGTEWVLLNAQNPFGEAVATGTYSGGMLDVPMTALTPATPVGAARPAPTGPEFNAFVLLFTPGPGEFFDVPLGNPFHDAIHTISTLGITAGCGGGNFCPDSPIKRSQMAVFLLKAEHGVAYAPPPATGTVFSDVPASGFAAAWIERLNAEGITGGCGGGSYCPNASVKRDQMSVFLLKTSLGAFYLPPAATGTVFTDVPANAFAAAWIEDLHARGIASGCGSGNYCPANAVSRGQMAAFLVSAFALN